jgi:ketosteroid isomerase-like protein
MRFADYMAAFNRYDDEALIRDFWTEDCVMQSGPKVYRGHKGMLEFLAWAHDGILETMRPQAVVEEGRRIFVEIDMDFTATRDRPDFLFGALKTGETATVKFFAHYLTRDGKVERLHTATWPPGVGVTAPPTGLLGGSPVQRQSFAAYTRAFSSAEMDVFPAYYTEDVVCELTGSGIRLEGRQGIVDFYGDMFRRVRESLTLHNLVADENAICADVTSTFTAIEDASDFAPMPLKKGQAMSVPVMVFYTLREGRICHIKVARSGTPQLG